MDGRFAVLGNRGVEDGSLDPELYELSVTLEIHGSRKQWDGNICYNDNHVEFAHTFWPEGITYLDLTADPPTRPDNLFKNDSGTANDRGDGIDIWLTLVSEIIDPVEQTLRPEWD